MRTFSDNHFSTDYLRFNVYIIEKINVLSEFPYPFLNPAYLYIHITVYLVNVFHRRLRYYYYDT